MADNWDRDRWDRYGGRGIERNYGRDESRDMQRDDYRDHGRDSGRDHFRDDDERYAFRGGEYGAGGGFGGNGFGSMNRDFETRGAYDRGSDRGESRGDYAPMQQQSFRGRGPKGFQRSDDRLRELVSERLADHHEIDASDIEVTVSNGEVTLQGTVDDRRTKRLAEDVVESVGGVRDVHNHLKVDTNFFNRANANTTGAAGQ